MPDDETPRPPRLPLVSIALLMVLWLVHIALREALRLPSGDPVRLATTAMLIAAFSLFVVVHVRLARSMDEFHRQLQYVALSVAYPLAVVALFAIGFLRGEGLLAGLDSRDLWVAALLPYVAGYSIAARRYR